MHRIYLDHAATTPLLPEAREAMLPWLGEGYGNPSSLHEDGRRAKDAIDRAREIISGSLGCLFAEVLFTSGGSKAGLHFSYLRYVENKFRESFEFFATPIRLKERHKRQNRER